MNIGLPRELLADQQNTQPVMKAVTDLLLCSLSSVIAMPGFTEHVQSETLPPTWPAC